MPPNRSPKSSPHPSPTASPGTIAKRRKRAPLKSAPSTDPEMQRMVLLDGLTVRRRRHDHGWSPRQLVVAIAEACFVASGLKRTLTPNQIQAIEERAERVPYEVVLLLADGLGCDPADLIAEGELSARRAGRPRTTAR